MRSLELLTASTSGAAATAPAGIGPGLSSSSGVLRTPVALQSSLRGVPSSAPQHRRHAKQRNGSRACVRVTAASPGADAAASAASSSTTLLNLAQRSAESLSSIAPSLPELPSLPSIPSPPSFPSLPALPSLPVLPSLPSLPSAPSLSIKLPAPAQLGDAAAAAQSSAAAGLGSIAAAANALSDGSAEAARSVAKLAEDAVRWPSSLAASAASASTSAAASSAGSGAEPAAVQRLLSSEQDVLKDLQDLAHLAAADSLAALHQAVAAVLSSPSIEKLGAASSRIAEDAASLADSLQGSAVKLGVQASEDPAAALSAVASLALEAPDAAVGAVGAGLTHLAQVPGAVPATGIGATVLAGLFFKALLDTLKDVQAKGKELPARYDPDAIVAYFKLRPGTVLVRSASVFAQVAQLVASIYWDRFNGVEMENERLRAKQTVQLITDLGPTAIKVGQALSIRPDLLSLAYLEELQTLQDRVASFSNDEARAIIREGLGKSADEIFMDMSPSPVAAASLGQVYKAKLRSTGETVAVKVQRPDVLEGICCDLLVLRIMALVLQRLPTVHTDLLDVLDTWARRFFDELDYVQEGKNALRFAEDMKDISNVTVPTVYMEYTSRKVLTTGWVEGEKLSDCQSSDLGTLVTTALNCYLIQLLETGFLHADPHPGNLLRTPDGKLCVLDFGLMTEVTKDQQYALIEYISHLVNSDFERVAEDLVVLGFVPPELVDPEKTAAVVPQLSRVLGQLTQGGGAAKINVAQVTDDLAKLSQEYVFVIPPYFALILRAFGVLEGIGLDHNPDYAIVDECYPYISKRLLTDDSPRARKALRYFLYGKGDKLNVARVEEMAQGLLTFRELMAAGAAPAVEPPVARTGPLEPAEGAAVAASARAALTQAMRSRAETAQARAVNAGRAQGKQPGDLVDPTAQQVLATIFSEKGSYLQELLLTELVKTVDALSREALAEQWSVVAARSALPVPQALLQPGTYPLPLLLPGAVAQLVRGTWRTASLSEEDQATLSTVRKLWAFLEPQLESTSFDDLAPRSPADLVPWAQEVAPLAQDLLPGVMTTGSRFLVMLAQRQALRLADDLDGGNAVEQWDRDPYAFARTIQPQLQRRPRQGKSS